MTDLAAEAAKFLAQLDKADGNIDRVIHMDSRAAQKLAVAIGSTAPTREGSGKSKDAAEVAILKSSIGMYLGQSTGSISLHDEAAIKEAFKNVTIDANDPYASQGDIIKALEKCLYTAGANDPSAPGGSMPGGTRQK